MKKSNDSNLIFKLNIFRIIAYIVLYGIFGVLLYGYFRSYICMLFLIIFFVVPFASVIMLYSMSKKLSINVFASDDSVPVNSEIGIGIAVTNNSIFSALNCKCTIGFKNIFYNIESKQIFSIPILAKSSNKNPLICKVTHCGLVHITLDKCEISDLCNIGKIIIFPNEEISILVMPDSIPLNEEQKMSLVDGYSDNENENLKGNEYTDVSDIREYIPGDRIKDIHWKLSAKKDVLLVRERIKSCENQLMVWMDSSLNKKYCERILTLTYSIMLNSINENVALKLLWFDYNSNFICERTINNTTDVIPVITSIYNSGNGLTVEDLKGLLTGANYSVTSIIRVGFNNQQIGISLYDI